MKSQNIFSQYPKFIEYLGGLNFGDSLLFISTKTNDLNSFISDLLMSSKITAKFLTVSGDINNIYDKFDKKDILDFKQQRILPKSAVNKARSFLKNIPKSSIVLCDDLQHFKKYFNSEKNLIKYFEFLVEFTSSKNAFLLTTLAKEGFSFDLVGRIKDIPTISLDTHRQGEDLFCTLLHSRNKYSLNRFFPLKLESRNLRKPPDQLIELTDNLTGLYNPRNIFNNDLLYAKVFKSSSQPYFIFDYYGDFREPNKKCAELLGYSVDELKIIAIKNILPEAGRYTFLKFLLELKNKRNLFISTRLKKKNDKEIPVDLLFNNLGDNLFAVLIRDTSDIELLRAELDISEEKYKNILNTTNSAIVLYDKDKLIFANQRFISLLPPEKTEMSFRLNDIFSSKHIREVKKIITRVMESGSQESSEYLLKFGKQEESIFQVIFSVIILKQKKLLQIEFSDISDFRKRINDLSVQKEKYFTTINESPVAITISKDNKIVLANNSFKTLFNINPEAQLFEIAKTDIGYHEKHKVKSKNPLSVHVFDAKIKESESFPVEMVSSNVNIQGEIYSIESYRNLKGEVDLKNDLRIKKNELNLLDQILRDVGASLEIQAITQKSLSTILKYLKWDFGAFYIKDLDDNFLLKANLGLEENLIEKINCFDSQSGVGGYLQKTHESVLVSLKSYPSFLPHRSTFSQFNFETICFIPLISNNDTNGFVLLGSTSKIIPDNYTNSLLSSIGRHIGSAISNATHFTGILNVLEKQEGLITNIPEVLYIGNLNEMFNYISPNVGTLFGYQPADFRKNKTLLLGILHPDDKKYVLQRNANLDNIKKSNTIEYRILPKGKAEYIWISDTISLVRDKIGAIDSIYGIISNINERKNLENTLRTTEKFKSSVMSSIKEGVFVFDSDLNFIEWNEAMEIITGIPRRDILGRNINSIPINLFGEDFKKNTVLALGGQTKSSEDVRYSITEKNIEGYLWIRYSPLETTDKNINGVVCFVSDVTKRKVLEENLKISEQLLKNVIDAIGDIFVMTDLQGSILEVNKQFKTIMGYTRAEAVGQHFPYPWLRDDEMNRFMLWISKIREKNFLHDFDITWITKDGRHIPMSISTTLLRNSYGKPVAMINLVRDITERKQMEIELAERNNQIEAINQIIQTANKTQDFRSIFKIFSEKINNLVDYDFIELGILNDDQRSIEILAGYDRETDTTSGGRIVERTSNISNICYTEGKSVLISDASIDEKCIIYNYVEDKYLSIISYPIFSKNKVTKTLNLYSTNQKVYSDTDFQKIKLFVEQIGPIIDRFQLFKQVTEDAAYIHNLLNSINNAVFTVDESFKINEANKSFQELLRRLVKRSKKNIIGELISEILPNEIFTEKLFNISKNILNGISDSFIKEVNYKKENEFIVLQLTINPMVIGGKRTGLVFNLNDITELKHTEAELKKRNNQLLNLNVISSSISTSLNITDLLNTVLPRILSVIGADYLFMLIADFNTGDLYLEGAVDSNKILSVPKVVIKLEDTISWKAYKNIEPIFISDNILQNEHLSPSLREIVKTYGVSAMGAVPLKSADKVIGVLDIFFKKPHSFSVEEHHLLALIGNQLGSVVENAQLYDQLKKQIATLTVLYDLSQQLTATMNLDQVIEVIYEKISSLVSYKELSINLVDEANGTYNIAAHIKNVRGEKIYIPNLNQQQFIQPQSVLWDSIYKNSILKEYNPVGNMVTYLPMATQDKVLGVMIFQLEADTYYTDTEIYLLKNIASLTAIALEKARLYEETLQKSSEISRRNKELDDFTYVVSHDLKEPLISIEGYSKILLEENSDILKSESGEFINSIVQASGRMKNLIDDLLTLSRLSRLKESFKVVSINHVLEEVKIDLQYSIKEKNVDIIVPEKLPEVYGNETQLKLLFRNLISNAIKFNDKGNPRVEISYIEKDQDTIEYIVKDNGIGIEENYFEKIFVIFQRLHSRDAYEGTGAGLAIVKKIIEMHNGKIWVESQIGIGTTFYFTLTKVEKNIRGIND